MSRGWMPLYVADYLADTGHLSAAEHGAYLLLIMHYWSKGGLPDDDRQLARIARMTPEEWASSVETIYDFFQDGWKHERIETELAEAQAAYDRRAAAGRKGGNAKAVNRQEPSNAKAMPEQSNNNADAMLKQSQSQSHISSSLRSEETSRDRAFALDVNRQFERFYAIFPKHTKKKPAVLKFCAAVKSGVDPEHIIAAAERFTEAHRLAGTAKQYIPSPYNWLKDGCYDDEDLPEPRAGPSSSGRASIAAVRDELIAELNGEIYGQNQSQPPDYSAENVIELVAFAAAPGERTG